MNPVPQGKASSHLPHLLQARARNHRKKGLMNQARHQALDHHPVSAIHEEVVTRLIIRHHHCHPSIRIRATVKPRHRHLHLVQGMSRGHRQGKGMSFLHRLHRWARDCQGDIMSQYHRHRS
mmetsp:Transcript_116819/g.302784  ORF Transcript_116819/g.302784 Transcript_116819/m.302784 type:complete len:121 (-) Transcript_116819:1055-1417(-)